MMKQILILSLVLLVGSIEGRELLLRRDNEGADVLEMEVEIDYSGQRRELAWGSGFSWFLYTMKLCHGPGPMCPSPPCGGPHHKKHPEWGCHGDTTTTTSSATEAVTTETTNEEYYELNDDEDNQNNNKSAGAVSGGFSTFSVIAYVLGGTALAVMLAGVIFKKRRGALDKQALEGSVARRLELLNSGSETLEVPEGQPPTFIEMPASTSFAGQGGAPTTNYASV